MVAKSTSNSCKISDLTKMSGKQQTKDTRMFNCVPQLHQAVHIPVFHTHRLYMDHPLRHIYCHPRRFSNLCQNFRVFFLSIQENDFQSLTVVSQHFDTMFFLECHYENFPHCLGMYKSCCISRKIIKIRRHRVINTAF